MVNTLTNEGRDQLSERALRASRGETILITEGRQPMAKLIAGDESDQCRRSLEQMLVSLNDIRS